MTFGILSQASGGLEPTLPNAEVFQPQEQWLQDCAVRARSNQIHCTHHFTEESACYITVWSIALTFPLPTQSLPIAYNYIKSQSHFCASVFFGCTRTLYKQVGLSPSDTETKSRRILSPRREQTGILAGITPPATHLCPHQSLKTWDIHTSNTSCR